MDSIIRAKICIINYNERIKIKSKRTVPTDLVPTDLIHLLYSPKAYQNRF